MKEYQEKTNHSRNRRCWHAHVKALKQSSLSRAEYCRQHKLSYHAMTYWCKRISRKKESQSNLVPVPFHYLQNQQVQPIREPLRLILSEKMSIEIGDNFSEHTLTKLLSVLEQR
jgi:transposase